MYEADLAEFKQQVVRRAEDEKAENLKMLAGVATCGLSCIFIGDGTISNDPTAKGVRRMRPIIDEMNTRHLKYGITWKFQSVRSVGAFSCYET